MENGIFESMCKSAADEVASGDMGWKDIDNNTMLLACFHMLTNHLTHNLVKPLWWFAGCVGSASIAACVGWLFKIFTGG